MSVTRTDQKSYRIGIHWIFEKLLNTFFNKADKNQELFRKLEEIAEHANVKNSMAVGRAQTYLPPFLEMIRTCRAMR